MLTEFKSWILDNTDYHIFYYGENSPCSAVVDVENDLYIARFTLWDDLSCMSEILDVNTSQYILNERNECLSINEVLALFKIFSKYLT